MMQNYVAQNPENDNKRYKIDVRILKNLYFSKDKIGENQ